MRKAEEALDDIEWLVRSQWRFVETFIDVILVIVLTTVLGHVFTYNQWTNKYCSRKLSTRLPKDQPPTPSRFNGMTTNRRMSNFASVLYRKTGAHIYPMVFCLFANSVKITYCAVTIKSVMLKNEWCKPKMMTTLCEWWCNCKQITSEHVTCDENLKLMTSWYKKWYHRAVIMFEYIDVKVVKVCSLNLGFQYPRNMIGYNTSNIKQTTTVCIDVTRTTGVGCLSLLNGRKSYEVVVLVRSTEFDKDYRCGLPTL